jgi:hypothetical protein
MKLVDVKYENQQQEQQSIYSDQTHGSHTHKSLALTHFVSDFQHKYTKKYRKYPGGKELKLKFNGNKSR